MFFSVFIYHFTNVALVKIGLSITLVHLSNISGKHSLETGSKTVKDTPRYLSYRPYPFCKHIFKGSPVKLIQNNRLFGILRITTSETAGCHLTKYLLMAVKTSPNDRPICPATPCLYAFMWYHLNPNNKMLVVNR